MASVSQRRVRRQGSYQSQRPAAPRRKPRRWLKRIVIGTTALAILVLVMPVIIAKTGLRNAPLRLAMANMHGTIEAGGASLSWFGPIEYTDIEIRNAQGELLVTLPKVESEKSLLGLLSSLNDLGAFRIEQPQVSLVMRSGGSNIEDVFAAKHDDAKPSVATAHQPAKLPGMALEIVDGTVKLDDTATNHQWELDKFNLKVRMSPDSPLPVELTLSGQVPFEGKAAQLSIASVSEDAASTNQPGPNGMQHGSLDHLEAKIDALPLAMFRALADRFAPGLQLSGTLSTDLRIDGLGANLANPVPAGTTTDKNANGQLLAGRVQVSGAMALDNFMATGGPLGSDRFALRRIELPCKVAVQNRQLDIEQLNVNCDIAQFSASGTVLIPQQPMVDAVAQLAKTALDVHGQLDLAKLAALLPSTLHIRGGTQITSGQVQLALANKPDAAGTTWTGQLVASNLAAVRDGRPVAWDQPINLQFAAREQEGGYALDQFSCNSSFLTCSGRGSLDQFHAEAQCDLDKLASELNQFVDLGQLRLAGHGNAKFDWQHTAAGQFQTAAEARLQGIQIAVPGKPVWQEESVVATAGASGSIENLTLTTLGAANLRRIDTAQLTATVDNTQEQSHEQIDVQLLQAVDGLATASPMNSAGINTAAMGAAGNMRWPIAIHVQSQLGRWWPRIASWLKLDSLDLSGACDLTAQVAVSNAGLEFQQIKAGINNFHAWDGNALFIDEPVVQLEAAGSYDRASGTVTLNRTSLLSSTVSFQTDAASFVMSAGKPISAQGNLVYQADMARLIHWISDPRVPSSMAVVGHLVGNVDVARSGTTTVGKATNTIDNFAVYDLDGGQTSAGNRAKPNPTRPPEPVWQEQRLTLSAVGGLDHVNDTLQLTSLDVASSALALHAAGKIDDITTRRNLDLAGQVNYDWQTLAPLLRPYLGKDIAIVGRQSRNFSIRGSLDVGGQHSALTSMAPLGKALPKSGGLAAGQTASSTNDKFAFLRSLTADVAFGWSQADVYGLRIGTLDVAAHLENGTLAMKPIDTTIGEGRDLGRLTCAPALRFSPGPAEFVLGKGPLLSNVPISDELADSWVKFIAPMIADATRTEGMISLELDSASIPLSDPKKADLGGRLVVQNMSVMPGPLFRPFAIIGQQLEAIVKGKILPNDLSGEPALLKINDQKVDFHLVDGRIYHQGLSMQVGEVTIRTRGWVGLDETVNLVAEIPLKDEWKTQRNSPLAGFKEDVISIPIQGNLKNPKFDMRVMTELVGTIPRAAIENVLNKGLDRLLGPPQR